MKRDVQRPADPQRDCPECEGSGNVDGGICAVCQGAGQRLSAKRFLIPIKGVEHHFWPAEAAAALRALQGALGCAPTEEWERLCGELRARESQMSGILCDLADVPSDPVEGLRVLAEYWRRQRPAESTPVIGECEACDDFHWCFPGGLRRERACHICGTTTAEHGSLCSAAGIPSTWDMGAADKAGPAFRVGDRVMHFGEGPLEVIDVHAGWLRVPDTAGSKDRWLSLAGGGTTIVPAATTDYLGAAIGALESFKSLVAAIRNVLAKDMNVCRMCNGPLRDCDHDDVRNLIKMLDALPSTEEAGPRTGEER